MAQLVLTVTGMTCGGCENAVRRAVSMLPGVRSVSASHAENRVTVEYEPSLTDDGAVRRAIEAAGYSVH